MAVFVLGAKWGLKLPFFQILENDDFIYVLENKHNPIFPKLQKIDEETFCNMITSINLIQIHLQREP